MKRHFNFPTVSSFSVGASISVDQKKMDQIAAASSVPLLLPCPWKCPRGSNALWEGGWQCMEEWAEASRWREGSTCQPVLTSAPLCQVEQPTSGSVMTFVYRWHCCLLAEKEKDRVERCGLKGIKKMLYLLPKMRVKIWLREIKGENNGWKCSCLLTSP